MNHLRDCLRTKFSLVTDMQSNTVPDPTELQLMKPYMPAPCRALDQPKLPIQELEIEVGGCEEWDEASPKWESFAVARSFIRWVESILGAW
jgi:hypothetical protein